MSRKKNIPANFDKEFQVPSLTFFKGPFGGAYMYLWREICISKSTGLAF